MRRFPNSMRRVTGNRRSRLVVPAIGMSLLINAPGAALAKQPTVAQNPGNYVEYALPVTTAKLTADMVLLSCTGGVPLAKTVVTITPVANPNPLPQQRFRLYGSNFSSFWKNRSFEVELHANDGLKSVNGAAADRTGAIISNVLKIGTGLVGMFGAGVVPSNDKIECNDTTAKALVRAERLRSEIVDQRVALASAPVGRAEVLRKHIDALASELARLRSEDLHLSLERELPFHEGAPEQNHPVRTGAGRVHWTGNELAKWLNTTGEAPVRPFSLAYCADRSTSRYAAEAISCTTSLVDTRLRPSNPNSEVQPARPGCWQPTMAVSCPRTLVTREPVAATIVVLSTTDTIKGGAGAKLQTRDLLISQWGTIEETRLDVGFGGNMSLKAGFDEFGRKTSMTWKSDSRGEAMTGALAGVVDGANSFRNAFDTNIEAQQAEILELETQQKLNKLRFCREVIEAGGFTCPTG